jgi:biuret amidohydrolase
MSCCSHDDDDGNHKPALDRRSLLKTGVMGAAAAALAVGTAGAAGSASAGEDPYADPVKGALPKTDVTLELANTALVVTDPQVDFLSPKGVTWKVVGKSVEHHGTVGNIELLLKTAKDALWTTKDTVSKIKALKA